LIADTLNAQFAFFKEIFLTLPPSYRPTQLINQPPDIWHRDKHRQAQFSRKFFTANQASVGRGQADFSAWDIRSVKADRGADLAP
jgi:hypothetical protein